MEDTQKEMGKSHMLEAIVNDDRLSPTQVQVLAQYYYYRSNHIGLREVQNTVELMREHPELREKVQTQPEFGKPGKLGWADLCELSRSKAEPAAAIAM